MSSSLSEQLRRVLDALLGRRLDHLALYPAVVVEQRADGTLDLAPVDARVPSCQGIAIRHGLPGVTVTVAAGERVLLGYEGGDPARPYAALWSAGSVTRIAVNGGTAKAAREGDDVTKTSAMSAWMSSVTGYINGAAPGTILSTPSVLGTISEGSDALRLP